MDIKEIIKERKKVIQTLKELDYKIGEHYMPIIQALKKNKDKEGVGEHHKSALTFIRYFNPNEYKRIINVS